MEQNEGTPPSFGRGRPIVTAEPRRPFQYTTYAGAADYVPTESNTNGICPEPSWQTPQRGNYL